MYFRDPNGIALELACFMRAFTAADVAQAPVDAAGKPVGAAISAALV